MKTFVYGDVRFHHSSGLDGDVTVVVAKTALLEPVPGAPHYVEFAVDGDAIKALVLDWLRGKAIGQLETADDAQLVAMMVHRLAGEQVTR